MDVRIVSNYCHGSSCEFNLWIKINFKPFLLHLLREGHVSVSPILSFLLTNNIECAFLSGEPHSTTGTTLNSDPYNKQRESTPLIFPKRPSQFTDKQTKEFVYYHALLPPDVFCINICLCDVHHCGCMDVPISVYLMK